MNIHHVQHITVMDDEHDKYIGIMVTFYNGSKLLIDNECHVRVVNDTDGIKLIVTPF